MRLIEYLLNEKISKKELKDVFDNDNILIGAEFEFIHEELEEHVGGGDLQQDYENAMRDYRQWARELEEWEMELEEIRDNQIETQDKIDDRRVDLEDVRNDIEDLTEEDFGNEDEDEVKKILDTLEELRKEESNLEKEIEKLEALFRDYENDAVDIVMYAMPQPGMNYVDYAENIMNVNVNLVDPSELPEPEEPNGREIDEDDWIEIAEMKLHESIEYANFINNYEIGGYGNVCQSLSNRVWAFEYDGTVSPYGGVEMKSPPLPLPEFLDILPDILDWIDQYGKTDEHCGLHFHMSLFNVNNLTKQVDMIKLILFSEENYIYKIFPNRIDNEYAQEVKNKILSKMKPTEIKYYISYLMGDKTKDPKQISDLSGGHYDAIHKVMDSKNPSHVEFRHPGGKGYHKKKKTIKEIIGKYATTLSIACDPDYKYHEYVQKVLRLLNKIEKVSLLDRKETLESLLLKHLENGEIPSAFSDIIKDVRVGKLAVKQYINKLNNQIRNFDTKVDKKERYIIGTKIKMGLEDIKQDLSKIIAKKK